MAGANDALYSDLLDRLQSIDSASPVHVEVTRVAAALEKLSESALRAFQQEQTTLNGNVSAKLMFYREVNQHTAGALQSLLDALMHFAANERGEARAKLESQKFMIVTRGTLKPVD